MKVFCYIFTASGGESSCSTEDEGDIQVYLVTSGRLYGFSVG
jgi:hypothetical protein